MAVNNQFHFVRSYEEFLKVLKEHENETGTKYTHYTAMKQFQEKDATLRNNAKIHWLENMPYFDCGSKTLTCHQGKDRNQSKKRKYALQRNLKASQDKSIKPYTGHKETKKLNCPVSIYLKRILKVVTRPDFPCMDRMSKEHMKRTYSLLIKEKLNQGTLITEEYFMFKLPKPEEHKYHLVGEEAINKATDLNLTKPRRSKTCCCICKSNQTNKELSFHRVPKSEEMLNKWRQVIGRNVKSDLHRVCSDHFSPSQYKEAVMDNGKKRKVLFRNAVPRVEKYSGADKSNSKTGEEGRTESPSDETTPQSSAVGQEHKYCATETTENTDGEVLVYEEVEVSIQDFEMSYLDNINSSALRDNLPPSIEQGISAHADESNLERIEETTYFDTSDPKSPEEVIVVYREEVIPKNTQEIIPGKIEETKLQNSHNTEESKVVTKSLKRKNYCTTPAEYVEIPNHKKRKLSFDNKKYLIVENVPITITPETTFASRQINVALNKINEREQSVKETSSVPEEPKEKKEKIRELTQECFTTPEYFQIYKCNKRKLKMELAHYRSLLVEIESKYAQLNSIVSYMKAKGIVTNPPLDKYLSPLMCNIVDRALFGNKLKVTPELKEFSSSLMSRSPNSYQFVSQGLMNALPREDTVKTWLRQSHEPRIYVVKKPTTPLV